MRAHAFTISVALLSLVLLACAGCTDDGTTSHSSPGAWQPMGTGISNDYGTYAVSALASREDELIAGFSDYWHAQPYAWVFRWNGTGWDSVGNHFDNEVSALTFWNGRPVAGGKFSHAGGAGVRGIAEWNGSTWQDVGGGVDGFVRALVDWNGRLVVAGRFSEAGGYPAPNIAIWDGDTWTALGDSTCSGLSCLTVWEGRLVAAGVYVPPLHPEWEYQGWIGIWNGASWTTMRTYTPEADRFSFTYIDAVGVYGNRLVASGTDLRVGLIPHIASTTGEDWIPLGGELSGGIIESTASCLIEFDSFLIAGGGFTRAGNLAAKGVARWDGTRWAAMDGGVAGPVAGAVYSSVIWNGRLVIGGDFRLAGSVPARNIAVWSE